MAPGLPAPPAREHRDYGCDPFHLARRHSWPLRESAPALAAPSGHRGSRVRRRRYNAPMREFMMIRGGLKRPESRQTKLVAFVVTWLITAAAVWVAAEMVGGIHLEGWRSTLLVALILGLLNAYVKPLLVLLGLP